jgi:hypothetical protein
MMMKTYKVILSKMRFGENLLEFFWSSYKDDLSLNYGEKHFITEIAEIAIINFFEDGVPEVFDEIDQFIERAWDKVQINKQSTMLSAIKQWAWRFFADLSPKGKIWYSEVMNPNEHYYDNEIEKIQVISEIELEVEPIKLEYKKWHSLSVEQKMGFAEWFVLMDILAMLTPILDTDPPVGF